MAFCVFFITLINHFNIFLMFILGIFPHLLHGGMVSAPVDLILGLLQDKRPFDSSR